MARRSLLGLVLLGGCAVGGSESETHFSGVTSLSLSLGSGEIYLSSSEDAQTVVRYDGGGIGRSARPEIEMSEDGALTVDGGGLFGGGDFDIALVPGVPITADLERGELTIELLYPSDIDACVGAGELSIGLPEGSYDLQIAAGAGEVEIGLVNDPSAEYSVRACAGAGEIDLYVFNSSL